MLVQRRKEHGQRLWGKFSLSDQELCFDKSCTFLLPGVGVRRKKGFSFFISIRSCFITGREKGRKCTCLQVQQVDVNAVLNLFSTAVFIILFTVCVGAVAHV